MRNPEDLRAFARRDWAAIARAKRAAWREQKRETGPTGALAAACELLRYARTVKPWWPTETDLEADRAVHLRVLDALRRVPSKRR